MVSGSSLKRLYESSISVGRNALSTQFQHVFDGFIQALWLTIVSQIIDICVYFREYFVSSIH